MASRISHRLAWVVAAVVAVVLLPGAPASATSVEELEEQGEELDRQEQELAEVLQARGEQYSAAAERLQRTKLELASLRQQLDDQRAYLAELEPRVIAGARDISMGRGGDLEKATAFFQPDLSEAFNGISLINHIVESDGVTYATLEAEEEKLADLESSVEATEEREEAETAEAGRLRDEAQDTYDEIVALGVQNETQLAAAQAAAAAAASGGGGGAVSAGPVPDWGGGAINCGGYMVTPPNATVAAAISWACSRLGTPYCWGGTGPTCYDCSGFTRAAYAYAGVSLPRMARDQGRSGSSVSRSNLVVGDLVLSNNNGHVSIYVGGGNVLHSPRTGRNVSIDPMWGFVGGSRPW